MTPRPRLLVGALLAAGGIWAADQMIGSGQPPTAAAGLSAPGASATTSIEWSDMAGLIEHLTNRDYSSVAAELDTLERDLFVPTPLVDATFNQIAAQWAAEQAAESEQEVPPEPGFDARHTLVAVIVGKQPRAVVDGRLLPLGAELDGHRLAEINRDRVAFQNIDTREHVVLELQQRPKTP